MITYEDDVVPKEVGGVASHRPAHWVSRRLLPLVYIFIIE